MKRYLKIKIKNIIMIKNTTKEKILSKEATLCKNIFSKALGLMFSKKTKTLIFVFKKEKINPLHMFFVPYPIDVLFLDKNKKVTEIKENFRPFTFYTPKTRSKYIIELKNKTIKETNTKVNDIISF